MRRAAALALAAALAGCGVKGPPQAPTEESAAALAREEARERPGLPERFAVGRRGRRAGPSETSAPAER